MNPFLEHMTGDELPYCLNLSMRPCLQVLIPFCCTLTAGPGKHSFAVLVLCGSGSQ